MFVFVISVLIGRSNGCMKHFRLHLGWLLYFILFCQVEGVGEPNPFRLRSLLGARIPVNATYSPLISMYNPFSTSLQVCRVCVCVCGRGSCECVGCAEDFMLVLCTKVTEMYSSGGDLHLELLTGQPQGSKNLWVSRLVCVCLCVCVCVCVCGESSCTCVCVCGVCVSVCMYVCMYIWCVACALCGGMFTLMKLKFHSVACLSDQLIGSLMYGI